MYIKTEQGKKWVFSTNCGCLGTVVFNDSVQHRNCEVQGARSEIDEVGLETNCDNLESQGGHLNLFCQYWETTRRTA